MKTRRVLSNISFNTLPFFSYVIRGLYKDNIIDWAYWIFHSADKDDKKQHIHFCFQPSKAIDTFDFSLCFLEFPFHGCRLPLKPTSRYQPVLSLDDWLLYCKHDRDYLLSKGIERNVHYDWSDFKSTDSDSLEHDINNIDYTKFNRMSLLFEGVNNHTPFADLVQKGVVPINFRSQYEAQYRALKRLRDSEKGLKAWEKEAALIPDNQIKF